MKKAIFIDIDNTLLDFDKCAYLSMKRSFEDFGLPFDDSMFDTFERVNLSVFSLLSMLGGMLLPLFAGIFFYGEKFTLGVGLCVAFVIAALLLTVQDF